MKIGRGGCMFERKPYDEKKRKKKKKVKSINGKTNKTQRLFQSSPKSMSCTPSSDPGGDSIG
jgi:hypothetical protein